MQIYDQNVVERRLAIKKDKNFPKITLENAVTIRLRLNDGASFVSENTKLFTQLLN